MSKADFNAETTLVLVQSSVSALLVGLIEPVPIQVIEEWSLSSDFVFFVKLKQVKFILRCLPVPEKKADFSMEVPAGRSLMLPSLEIKSVAYLVLGFSVEFPVVFAVKNLLGCFFYADAM